MESVDHGYDLHLEDIKDPYHNLEQVLMYICVALLISIVALTFVLLYVHNQRIVNG
jgi:hypothetical protein